ncbi:recombination regulator RecX [Bacillus testis]|uniref:recombination regulator RecX n=1 Tax=Bacillus testis TaxID=1622072 RepID=UPI00067F3027|nr:recombination regulator RecX [Bacillus testis]
MTIITKISAGKKNKNRYNIFIDKGSGEEFGFSVSEDVLIKMDLKKGKTIDEFELAEIIYQEEIQKAFSAALHYLSHRMRSETEVVRHLRDKEYESHIIKEVIHRLYHLSFLDDEAFASAFVRTKMNAGDKGPIVIAQDLRLKGVADTTIDAALHIYSREMQVEHAQKQIGKLLKSSSGKSTIQLKRKVEQTLQRKGFPSYIIEEASNKVDLNQDEKAEWESLVKNAEKAGRRLQKYSGYEFEQRLKSALYRKGFPLELIDRYLEENPQGMGE